ncbi:MAG: glycosyltransferase [Candidatus Limnocylindrales bacterium]
MTRSAFVSTYPPRHCGIATFCQHLATAVGGREIVALHASDLPSPYPLEVHHRLRVTEPEEFPRTAASLRNCADVVSIQHAFGIWGPDETAVLEFSGALEVPAVATLHNVPATPTPEQHRVISGLTSNVAGTVALSHAAATLLTEVYDVDPATVTVIPHGVPDLPFLDAETVKPAVGMGGRDVLLSFGLLSPGKGIELALEALPAIIARRPTTTYVVLGTTNPNLTPEAAEAYRAALVAQADRLGVGAHVQFLDRFVGRVELIRWLEAADVIVAPYADPGKSASGTLPYALGAGRPVVATAFAHAREVLADGRGVLVPHGDPAALASAVVGLLDDTEGRLAMGRLAHEHSRSMTWWQIGARHRELLQAVASAPVPRRDTRRPPGRLA